MITSFSVEDTPGLLVELEAGRVWELTTEIGTRHIVDRRDGKIWRLRMPGSGRAMAWADGYWDSTALSVRPVDYAQFRESGILRPPREGAPTCEVELGASAFFAGDERTSGTGAPSWWPCAALNLRRWKRSNRSNKLLSL